MRGRYVALSILALVAGVAGGISIERFHFAAPKGDGETGPKIRYWVAPMDANFRKDGPGKSPMGMDLVPVYEGDEPSGDPGEVSLSPREVNAIGVRTALARVEQIAPVIETVGFVTYDEDATSHVHARIMGWVEGLAVRAVGDPVTAGQPLFEIYGPRQEQETMDRIGAPAEYLRVTAPQSGVVTALGATDGMYLEPGMRAMSITDLASVWVIADVFERDIGRLTTGMRAEIRFEPLPRDVFEGEIDYIYPELDPKTRTLSVRIRLDNRMGKLRPNMFGTVRLREATEREAVTVLSEAVIRTGRAERVILDTGEGTYLPRLVTTGLRDAFGAGGRTEIVQGLAPGETIVASAQFLIDSESALSAGLTRMAPTEDAPASGKGVLVAYDAERRSLTVEHEPIPALDWPAMETTFTLRDGIDTARFAKGDVLRFDTARGADGLLSIVGLRSDDGVDAVGTGMVRAVTPDGLLTLAHDPIPALSWPAMVMDLAARGVDLGTVPLNTPVEFDLAAGEGGTFDIIGVRAVDGAMPMMEKKETPAEADPAPPMTVSGTINSVDPDKRVANVTHGPMMEIGMPGMTMDFPLAAGLAPGDLPVGNETTLLVSMDPETFEMTLVGVDAPTDPPMEVMGTINSIDADKGVANITHGPMMEIGMPGMTMDFPLASGLAPGELPVGQETTLRVSINPETFEMTLVGVDAPTDPPMEVMGTINSIDADKGVANITHGPMAAIGMPGMTMDFPLAAGLAPGDLPVGNETTLLVSMNPETFEMSLVGVVPGATQ